MRQKPSQKSIDVLPRKSSISPKQLKNLTPLSSKPYLDTPKMEVKTTKSETMKRYGMLLKNKEKQKLEEQKQDDPVKDRWLTGVK